MKEEKPHKEGLVNNYHYYHRDNCADMGCFLCIIPSPFSAICNKCMMQSHPGDKPNLKIVYIKYLLCCSGIIADRGRI
jgi:hypothetical protein